MKSFIRSIPALAILAVALSAAPIRAEKGHAHKQGHDHDHGKGHDHAGHDHEGHDHAAPSIDSHAGMTALFKHLGEMDAELVANNLAGIHGHDEAIQTAVGGLDRDSTLTDAKRKKVQGYAKNVQKISGRLHGAADAKNLDLARKELVKLKAQVELLDRQFGHSHKPAVPGKSKAHGHAHPPQGK